MSFEWIEIAVVMKKLKAVRNAAGGNQAVDGLPNGNAPRA
jgi:hypothetical protein